MSANIADIEIAAINPVNEGGNNNGVEEVVVNVVEENGVEIVVNVVEENGDGGGRHRRRRRRGCTNHRRRRNIPLDNITSTLIFTNSEDHTSPYLNAAVGSSEMFSCYGGYRPEGVDVEAGKVVRSSGNHAKRCRICHLNFERGGDDDDDGDDDDGDDGDGGDDEDDDDRGYAMELGCDCKGDLGTAHQQCAVTWFLIRGSLNCEICGAIAKNLCFQPIAEENYDEAVAVELHTPESEPEPEPEPEPEYVPSPLMTEPVSESQISVYSRWFVNGVLACMAITFVISWLIHYNNFERSY